MKKTPLTIAMFMVLAAFGCSEAAPDRLPEGPGRVTSVIVEMEGGGSQGETDDVIEICVIQDSDKGTPREGRTYCAEGVGEMMANACKVGSPWPDCDRGRGREN